MNKLGKPHRIIIVLSFTLLGILFGAVVLPLMSSIVFSIWNVLVPQRKINYTFSVVFPLIWAPILGMLLGFIGGLKTGISQAKRYDNKT